MKTHAPLARTAARTLALAGTILSLAAAPRAIAQAGQPGVDPATHAAHVAQNPAAHAAPPAPAGANKELTDQIAALRAQVAELQAVLAQGYAAAPAHPSQPSQPGSAAGMGGGMSGQPTGQMGMGRMGMQPQQPAPPGGTPGMTGGGMDNDQAMMAMMQQMMQKMDRMMGGMGGMGGMSGGSGGGMSGGGMMMMDEMMAMGTSRMGGGSGSMISALPGFPGASHIYHVGATGFFLDHATHITLTPEQQRQLNQIKEQSLLDQATQQRKIDQAEQDLWNLTGADSPDAAKIEAKAREIAQLQAEQRTSFIRDVGKAAAVLADEQRKQLTGMAAPNPAPQGMPAGGAMPGMGGGGM